MSILPSHCRAARAFLDIGSRRIGARAIVSSDTIADSEIGDRTPLPNSLAAISAALDAAGIVIDEAARGKASGSRRSGTRAYRSAGDWARKRRSKRRMRLQLHGDGRPCGHPRETGLKIIRFPCQFLDCG